MNAILSTNHTSFTVSDLDRSISFFRDVLGFEVTSKAPRAPEVIARVTGIKGAQVMIAYVRGPGHSIELIEYIGPDDRTEVRPRACARRGHPCKRVGGLSVRRALALPPERQGTRRDAGVLRARLGGRPSPPPARA